MKNIARLSVSLTMALVLANAGCSFRMGTGAQAAPPPAQATAAAAQATPAPSAPSAQANPGPVRTLGRVKPAGATPGGTGGTTTSVPPYAAPTNTPPATGTLPVLVGTNIFGQATPELTGWKGSFFALPPATQKLPPLATTPPTGILFAKELNVASKAMTGGFPGIDATRNENFALRWEAPLVVDTESDYAFRLVSDDGSRVLIDGLLIVDNDGAHTVKEVSGPVHLVKGAHAIVVDYFQTTGPVALQLFCKKANGVEMVCPTHLP